jgi:hypothetical protein
MKGAWCGIGCRRRVQDGMNNDNAKMRRREGTERRSRMAAISRAQLGETKERQRK